MDTNCSRLMNKQDGLSEDLAGFTVGGIVCACMVCEKIDTK